MADINLLQTRQAPRNEENIFRVLNYLGVFLLVLVVAIYAALFLLTKQSEIKIQKAKADEAAVQNALKANPKYSDLVSSQKKLKVLGGILDAHVDWSKFLPSFAEATLRSANYSQFLANGDGTATITGSVPTFSDLDKLIKAYQLQDFTFIKDVKLTNIALASDDTSTGINFTVKVTFNPNILQWDLNKAQK